VLTETRVDICAVKKIKLKYGLKPVAYSLHRHPRGRVILFSRPEHKLFPDSVRMSENAGHIVAAVFEINSLPTVVVGVYGNSDSSDRASLAVMEELRLFTRELSQIYQTQRILLAGDFNVALKEADTNRDINHKPLTSELMKEIIEEHQLVDIGLKANNTQHTWFRKDSSGQSSRLDYIFSSIPTCLAKIMSTFTIFDHTYLEATLNPSRIVKQMTMKDFILGSDEYLIQSQELLASLVSPFQPLPSPPTSPLNGTPPPLRIPSGTGALDENNQIEDKGTGHTSLHFFNDAVHQLQHLHDQIAQNKRTSSGKRLRDTSSNIFHLKKQLRKPGTILQKQEITDQINHLQHELASELEAKDLASTLRIKNFYTANSGKMVPETFHCIKEPKRNRTIHTLQHEGRLITNTDEIMNVMQKWHEHAAERVVPQMETLASFLTSHD
jgi:exonuclease III